MPQRLVLEPNTWCARTVLVYVPTMTALVTSYDKSGAIVPKGVIYATPGLTLAHCLAHCPVRRPPTTFADRSSIWLGYRRNGGWARVVSNHRPLACEASALPLSYVPLRPDSIGLSSCPPAGPEWHRGAPLPIAAHSCMQPEDSYRGPMPEIGADGLEESQENSSKPIGMTRTSGARSSSRHGMRRARLWAASPFRCPNPPNCPRSRGIRDAGQRWESPINTGDQGAVGPLPTSGRRPYTTTLGAGCGSRRAAGIE